jgi:hypothetical protein
MLPQTHDNNNNNQPFLPSSILTTSTAPICMMVTPTLLYHVVGPNDVQFVDAIRSTMQQAFGFTPFAGQENVLTRLLKISSCHHPVTPAPTFLCQPTGGGKSLVCDVYTAGRGGISW